MKVKTVKCLCDIDVFCTPDMKVQTTRELILIKNSPTLKLYIEQ